MKTLEQFDKEIAAKRKRLEKDHALVHALPTTGKSITWTGEGGWDGNTRKPDVTRTIELAPWLVHSPFRGAEQVTFRAPDSLPGDQGEHVSSPHRAEFVRRYFLAVLDAFEPYIINTVAIKGRYASYVPESYDWENDRNYKDAVAIERGLFQLEKSISYGQNSYQTSKLEFYVCTDAIGPLQVSFDISDFPTHKAAPRPRRRTDNPESGIVSWDVPLPSSIGAAHVWRRGGADRSSGGAPWSYTLEWLFDSREALLTLLGVTP